MKVRIVTDSTADLPPHLLERWNVSVVPLKVTVGGVTYLDGKTITPKRFYELLRSAGEFPATSQPAPADFLETYRRIAEEEGEDVQIISLHLAAALSGTCQSAKLAQSMVADTLDVTVIDTKGASLAQGLVVLAAAKAAAAGKPKEECIALAERIISRLKAYFLVDTLDYLQKGGRIGKASAVIGSLLNIKPILSLNEEGEIYAFDKARGTKKAEARIFEVLQEEFHGKVIASVVHADDPASAERFVEEVRTRFEVEELIVTDIGPVIGAHVGPKTLGVVMHPCIQH
ncbi:DegV family protein [Bacillaceae bacterium]